MQPMDLNVCRSRHLVTRAQCLTCGRCSGTYSQSLGTGAQNWSSDPTMGTLTAAETWAVARPRDSPEALTAMNGIGPGDLRKASLLLPADAVSGFLLMLDCLQCLYHWCYQGSTSSGLRIHEHMLPAAICPSPDKLYVLLLYVCRCRMKLSTALGLHGGGQTCAILQLHQHCACAGRAGVVYDAAARLCKPFAHPVKVMVKDQP